ncbi:Calcium-dependent protein kinase 4 [Physocladia obscura]|uniref:Calcium-dependent protein kinase 4 n=1 Tax=Physocladia obscura TaxID=109957 RepID=A0AAD5T1S5_9FUNG|nr:Calcium-dependent protein kinase 4 [Physocladia obscura]
MPISSSNSTDDLLLGAENTKQAPFGTRYQSSGSVSDQISLFSKTAGFNPTLDETVRSSSRKTRKHDLYKGLCSESKVRRALPNAFSSSITAKKLTMDYKIAGIVGYGSNGVVLAVCDSKMNPMAVKIIYKTHQSGTPVDKPHEIFILETLTRQGISPQILQFHESWQDEFHHYMVTEYVGNCWLDDSVKLIEFEMESVSSVTDLPSSIPASSGSTDLWAWSYSKRLESLQNENHTNLQLHAVKAIIKEIAIALHCLHAAGFYHGDVKSENVICDLQTPPPQQCEEQDLNIPEIILADFGHARRHGTPMNLYGTPDVSPPEFLADSPFLEASSGAQGAFADVFALGIVMYMLVSQNGDGPKYMQLVREGRVTFFELLKSNSGDFPFEDSVEGRDNEELGAGFWDLIKKMCRVDPNERIQMAEVALHAWLN